MRTPGICLALAAGIISSIAIPLCVALKKQSNKESNPSSSGLQSSSQLQSQNFSTAPPKQQELKNISKPPELQKYFKKLLPEPTDEQMEKFKRIFRNLAIELEYDKDSGNRIDEKVGREVNFKDFVNKYHQLLDFEGDELIIYGEYEAEAKAKYCLEIKKGVCRHFTFVLNMLAREIGFSSYMIASKNHAATLYKWKGEWYVADLANWQGLEEDRMFTPFRVPLRDYLQCAMNVEYEYDRKNISVWLGYKKVPLDEFLNSH